MEPLLDAEAQVLSSQPLSFRPSLFELLVKAVLCFWIGYFLTFLAYAAHLMLASLPSPAKIPGWIRPVGILVGFLWLVPTLLLHFRERAFSEQVDGREWVFRPEGVFVYSFLVSEGPFRGLFRTALTREIYVFIPWSDIVDWRFKEETYRGTIRYFHLLSLRSERLPKTLWIFREPRFDGVIGQAVLGYGRMII